MKAITAYKGVPHITTLMDSMFHQGLLEKESCIFDAYEKFKQEVVSNNEIRIGSGIGMIQGRLFCIEPNTHDPVTIANGNQGENRIDIIVMRWSVDEETGVDDAKLVVVQGTPTTGTPQPPETTEGKLDDGDLVADYPIAQVRLTGINITSVTPLFSTGWILSDETVNAFTSEGLIIT